MITSPEQEQFIIESAMRTTLDFTTHYVKEIVKSRWNMNKKDNNSDLSLGLKDRKATLQYKIEYEGDDTYNIKPT